MAPRLFRALSRDRTGAALVEFALVAPVLLTMLLGVVQVGSWVQSYNAVRNLVNDTARFTMVEYQRGNKIDNDSVEDRAKFIAASSRYNLIEVNVVPDAVTKTTQVNGVKQLNLKVTYTPPKFVPFVSATAPAITYDRDIYLYDQSATVGS